MTSDTEIETENLPLSSASALVPENTYDSRSSIDPPVSDAQLNGNDPDVPPPNDEKLNTISFTDADFLSKIHALHCPFTWNPEEHLKTYRRDEIEDLMGVDEMHDETGFKLRRFVIYLILAYNNYCKRMMEESINNLDEMEKMLLASMKNKSKDVYFVSINDALFHILQSCRVVMLNAINRKEKALQILRKIIPYNEMNNCNKAGVWAVRANLYVEFGYDGVKAAIEYMKRATEIDEKNPYWYFMKGVYLGRLRRLESGFAIPSVDEIASLEYAMKLKDDASFFAFAAEVYLETADRTLKQYQELFLDKCQQEQRNEILKKNDLLNKHAAMLFKKSVELNSNCAHLLFRCGKGLLKLPPPYQDVNEAYRYLQKGLELSYESSYGNHAMAMYYEKHEENYEVAKKYLKKAVEHRNFGADLDLIRIRYFENRDSEALLNSLKKLFEVYPDGVKHKKILAEIISYYLFLEYNLTQAINHMKKLLYLIGENDEIIRTFKSGVLRQRLPCSLLAVLLSDITDRSNKETFTSEEQELCKTFLNRLCCQNIALPPKSNENLREKISRDIKAIFKCNQGRSVKPRSKSPTKIEPVEKEYDPVSNRFTKEYAKKYYIDKNDDKKITKTAVEEFFAKYEAEAIAKANKTKNEPPTSAKFKKPKEDQGETMNPTVQRLFDNMKKSKRLHLKHSDDSDSESKSDSEKKNVYKMAKQFERRFDISPEKGGDENDRRFRSGSRHRRRSTEANERNEHSSSGGGRPSARSSRKNRSVSRESRRSHKPSTSRNRSLSRESRKSRKPSTSRNRSLSRESRKSRKPSISRNRSLSRESRRSAKPLHKRRSASRESYRSRRNRSTSRETYKLRKTRSRSRDSRKSYRRDRYGNRHERSDSEESHRSSKTAYRSGRQKGRHKYYETTSSSGSSYRSFYSDSDSSSDHRRYHKSKKKSSRRRKSDSYEKRHRNEKYKSRRSPKEYTDSDTDGTSYTDDACRSSSRSPAREKKSRRKRSASRRSTSRSSARKFSSTETLKDTHTSSGIEDTKKRPRSRVSTRSHGTTHGNDRYNSDVKRSISRESHRSSKSCKNHKDDRLLETNHGTKKQERDGSSVEKRISDQHSDSKESGKPDSDDVCSKQSHNSGLDDSQSGKESDKNVRE